eukprot:8356072-Pyramimonas_sp.AAC.2
MTGWRNMLSTRASAANNEVTWLNKVLTVHSTASVSSPSAEWRAPCRRPCKIGGRIEFSSGGVA